MQEVQIGIAAGHVKKELRTSQCNKRGKWRKTKSNLECFNYEKQCHFARDYIELKNVHFYFSCKVSVTSHVMVVHSYSMWIVDSGAIEYITRDWVSFMEYHKIATRSRDIELGNGASVEVLELVTYKLDL